MEASFKGEIGTVKQLMDDSDDANEKATATRRSALVISAEHGNKGVVEVLLKGGTNIDMQTKFLFETALMKACENGYLQVAKLLVERSEADQSDILCVI